MANFMYNLGAEHDPTNVFRPGKMMHDPEAENWKPKDMPIVDELSEENQKEVTMGTTILATVFNGGVMLACDGRTAAGRHIANYSAQKITMITDKIFVLRSGSAADTQNMAHMVTDYMRQLEIEMGHVPVEAAARLFQHLAFYNRGSISAGFIVAGWDEKLGGQVYNVPSGGSRHKLPYTLGGSGSIYIYGWADATWKPDMTEEEAKAWCQQAVAHAKARDCSSGGNTRFCTVTAAKTQHEMLPWSKTSFTLEGDKRLTKLAEI
eukprot:gene1101-1684_t